LFVSGCASFHAEFTRDEQGNVITADAAGKGMVASGDVTVETRTDSIFSRLLDTITLGTLSKQ